MVICVDLKTAEELFKFLKESKGMFSEILEIFTKELEDEIDIYYDDMHD